MLHANSATVAIFHVDDLAGASGVSARLIRYYETIGLLTPPVGEANGYRPFSERDVRTLRFIQCTQSRLQRLQDCRQALEGSLTMNDRDAHKIRSQGSAWKPQMCLARQPP